MILKLTTSINPELKSRILYNGTFFALIGVLVLIGGGIFLPPKTLGSWGLPLFAASFGSMAWGMIPYRRLCMLEKKPNLICITDEETFQFHSKGKHILSLPTSLIGFITFRKGLQNYGIELKLKRPTEQKITVFGNRSILKPLKKGACPQTFDLFFPYFSERAFKKLNEELKNLKDVNL
ncbi:MAG: hypothetical protein H0T62_00860 [Parachlamydiaceae bacterium]|nr:hypothetical protein [Parachlamydiaceae bacterium]